MNCLKIAKYVIVVKIKLNMNDSIDASVKSYVFHLIKIKLQWSMKMLCMDDTKGEALMTLKIVC